MVAPALVFAGGVAVGRGVRATNRALGSRGGGRGRVLVGLEVAEADQWRVLRRPTSHEKNTKKGRPRRARQRTKRQRRARRRVHQPHRRVSAHGRHVVDMLHACASVDVRAVSVRRARLLWGETTSTRQSGRDVDNEPRERQDAYQTRGKPAALARDRARGRRLRGVRRAGRGRVALHVPLQPVRPARRGRRSTTEAKWKRKAPRGETTRREEEREKNTNANGKATGAFGSSFWTPQPAGRSRRARRRSFPGFWSSPYTPPCTILAQHDRGTRR